LLSTYISPLFTTAAKNVGFSFPEGATAISSLVDGAVPTTAIFIFGAKLGYIGLVVIGLIALATAYYINRRAGKNQEDQRTA
jgi:PTS system galactitol-specific IIC component